MPPTSPSPLPGPARFEWGQTTAFGLAPYRYLRHLQRRHGDTHRLRLAGMGELVLYSAPEDVQAVFSLKAAEYENGNDPVRYLLDPRSVVFLEGEAHRRARKAMTPPFAGRALRGYAPRFVESAQRVSADWRAGQTIDLTAAFQEVTFDALMGATLGMGAADCPPALRAELLRFVSGQLSSAMFFASAVMGPRLYARLRAAADGGRATLEAGGSLTARTPLQARAYNLARVELWLAELVAARRAAPSGGADALSRLVAEGDAFSDTDVVTQLLTLLVAGHDTTSLALSWVVAQLLARPALLERVVAEALAVEDPAAAESVADALPLLHAVVQESLRFTPGAAVAPRRLVVDRDIAGRRIAAGTVVAANVIGAHSRVATWGDPEVFRPERFLDAPPAPNTFFPFGGGLRRCLGAAFAQAEMPLVLAVLLRAWRLTPVARRAPIPAVHGFLIGPARHVRARVAPRRLP